MEYYKISIKQTLLGGGVIELLHEREEAQFLSEIFRTLKDDRDRVILTVDGSITVLTKNNGPIRVEYSELDE